MIVRRNWASAKDRSVFCVVQTKNYYLHSKFTGILENVIYGFQQFYLHKVAILIML